MKPFLNIVTIVGARPQFIKSAAVTREIEHHNAMSDSRFPKIRERVIHTGQHYDNNMSDVFFSELQIPDPEVNLGIGSGSHGRQTGRMLIEIEQVLKSDQTDCVLVYGDTNSTIAGALAAVKLHIPVAHVESGLRSFNRMMPEEHNRVLTDHCADILFCPSDTAVKNLTREGVTEGVYNVGDVMFDSLLFNLSIAEEKSTILDRLTVPAGRYGLATVHRAENTDQLERLKHLIKELAILGETGMPVIFPMHPRTRRTLDENGISCQNLQIIDPVSYLDMIKLEKEAKIILTDSGGIQKEAFWLKVPCITLRDETEWIETVDAGWNVLTGSDFERIHELCSSHSWPQKPPPTVFGDGTASRKIIDVLQEQFHHNIENIGVSNRA